MDNVILVTGANGFVGRRVIRRLCTDSSVHVVATDVQENMVRTGRGDPSNLSYVRGNLSDRRFCEGLVETSSPSCVMHLGGLLSKGDDPDTHQTVFEVNVRGTLNILEAVRERKPRVVFPSTGLIYGNHQSPFREDMEPRPGDFYALSKHLAEQTIVFGGRRYAIPYVILRIAVIYGPGQGGSMFVPALLAALHQSKEFPMTGGEQKRDLVHVDDVAAAFDVARTYAGRSDVFNVSSGQPRTMREVAALAEEIVGVHGKVKPGALPYRDNEVWEYSLDNTKAREHLGWAPGINLHDGLTSTAAGERRSEDDQ